jgi:hypothetical protein
MMNGMAGRVGAGAVLVSEILAAPDWAYVEATILGRYTDESIASAVRLLGGPRAADESRATLVELLREQYRRHEQGLDPTGRGANRPEAEVDLHQAR